jgi:hypothetical protein
MVGSTKQEDHGLGSLGKKMRPCLPITRAKRAGGLVQAVEHLPGKCEALSSVPQKKLISSVKFQDTKINIQKSVVCFYTLTMNYLKRKFGKFSAICNSTKKDYS